MKKLFLGLVLAGASAFAGTITYTTSGTFSSTGTSSDAVLSFSGVPNGSYSGTVSVPGNVGLGIFTDIATGSVTDNFSLNINVTSPPPGGSNTNSSPITGTIVSNGNTIQINWTNPTETIDGIVFQFQNTILNPPNQNNGQTTIQAITNTPEPASLSMIGAGLIGLGLVARRRLAK